VDDTLLIFLNAYYRPVSFSLPNNRAGLRWELVLDTREPTLRREHRLMGDSESYELEARSLALFVLRTGASGEASSG